MTRQTVNPDTLFNSLQHGFSQIAIGQGTRFVTISGQVGWDVNKQIVGKHDLQTQTMESFKNLERAMTAVGGTLDDILSLRIYILDSVLSEKVAVKEGLQAFFPTNPPTSTWIGVPALASGDFLIEIEAFAILP